MRQHPERRITNAFQVEDISTVVKDDSALVIVTIEITEACLGRRNDSFLMHRLIEQIKSNGESLIRQSYNFNNKTCLVTLVEQTFLSRPQTFTYPKNSSLVAGMDIG